MSFVLRKASIITKWSLIRAFLSIETNVNCLYQPTQSASLKKYWNLHMPTVSLTEAKVTRENVQISVLWEVKCKQIQYLCGSDQTKNKKKDKKKIHRQSLICCWKKDLPLNTSPIKNYNSSSREQTHRENIYIHRHYWYSTFFVNMTEKQPWILMNMLADKKRDELWTMNCNHELKNNIHTCSN